ncbi:hypothetical protein CR513_44715, partial [Mucuna pruriens]
MPIRDEFPNEQLLQINTPIPWFANIFNFPYKKRLKSDAKYYIWDNPYLWRVYNDQHLETAIMDKLGRPRKCLIVGSNGPPFLETLINSSPPAKNA